MKKIILAAVILALIGGGVYYWKAQTVKKEVRYASFDVISKTRDHGLRGPAEPRRNKSFGGRPDREDPGTEFCPPLWRSLGCLIKSGAPHEALRGGSVILRT